MDDKNLVRRLLRIHYVINMHDQLSTTVDACGLRFVHPDPANGQIYQPWQLYTQNEGNYLSPSTRHWLPCIDSPLAVSSWNIEFIVPNHPPRIPTRKVMPFDSTDYHDELSVICVGQFMGKSAWHRNMDKSVWRFRSDSDKSVAASSIGFAIGEFQTYDMSKLVLKSIQSTSSTTPQLPPMFSYASPSTPTEILEHTCEFHALSMILQRQNLGAFPFSSYQIVFVRDPYNSACSYAGLSLINDGFLHPKDLLEGGFEARQIMELAFTSQWFGVHISPKDVDDVWLIGGLARHTAAQVMRLAFGINEHRYRLKKDISRCCQLDVDKRPLSVSSFQILSEEDEQEWNNGRSIVSVSGTPPVGDELDFLLLKGPLVLHILDLQMKKEGTPSGLNRAIPKVLTAAYSGELGRGNALSSRWFLRSCSKVARNISIQQFADQWIFKSGCPVISLNWSFSRKKLAVEIDVSQICSDDRWRQTDRSVVSSLTQKSSTVNREFSGELTVRVREADGIPYEHVIELNTSTSKHEVQYNTKYTRIRLPPTAHRHKTLVAENPNLTSFTRQVRHSYESVIHKNQMAPQWGALDPQPTGRDWCHVEWPDRGGKNDDAEKGIYTQSNAYAPAVDPGEADGSGFGMSEIYFVRVDPEMEWIAEIRYIQPPEMWSAQLSLERDVVGQLEV